MKALSLKQPWASLIRDRYKLIETRTWKTDYRGDLLICSSKIIDRLNMEHFKDFYRNEPEPDSDFPLGQAIAIVEVVDCVPMEKEHEHTALCEIYPNAYSWILNNIRPIKAFPVKGQLGIFDVDVKPEDLEFL